MYFFLNGFEGTFVLYDAKNVICDLITFFKINMR